MIESIQKLTPIAWDDVVVRDPIASDIESFIDYYYELSVPLPFTFIDRSKRGKPEDTRRRWNERIAGGDFSQSTMLVVEYKGKAIGCHTLTPLLKTHSDFHAHFWDPEARGKKIGILSWYKASDIFFKRFGLERLYFKPPVANPYSSKAIKALGLRQLPDEILQYEVMMPGTLANVYEITRAEFNALR